MTDDLQQADVIAFVEAWLRDDEEAATALVDMVGASAMLGALLGMLNDLVGRDNLVEFCASWRRNSQL